jgi:hypothetical protein
MKNIHLIRTNLSRLYYTISMSGYNLKLSATPIHQSSEVRPQHIYITSDEQIKDGDWMIRGNEQPTLVTPNFFWDFGVRYYKIILTTDQDLIGVQAIDDEFLEWFVKNPSCEYVEIGEGTRYEDEWIDNEDGGEMYQHQYCCYKIIIPSEEPKDVVLGYETSLDAQMLDKVEPKQEVNYYSSNLFTEKKEAIEFADYLLGNFEMAEFEKEHPKYVVDDELCWQLAGTQQKYTTVEMYQIWLNESTKTK